MTNQAGTTTIASIELRGTSSSGSSTRTISPSFTTPTATAGSASSSRKNLRTASRAAQVETEKGARSAGKGALGFQSRCCRLFRLVLGRVGARVLHRCRLVLGTVLDRFGLVFPRVLDGGGFVLARVHDVGRFVVGGSFDILGVILGVGLDLRGLVVLRALLVAGGERQHGDAHCKQCPVVHRLSPHCAALKPGRAGDSGGPMSAAWQLD